MLTGINVDVRMGVEKTAVGTSISVGEAAGWLPQDTRNTTNKMPKRYRREISFIGEYNLSVLSGYFDDTAFSASSLLWKSTVFVRYLTTPSFQPLLPPQCAKKHLTFGISDSHETQPFFP